ncbi:hypothetical protein EDD15DRAFT_2173932, partial [Pisolithus albus]
GATCSGKTTLAKHLCKVLPNSIIICQDDFAPYNVEDWDSPENAIDWHRFRQMEGFLLPKWRSHFEEVECHARENHGTEISLALVDGFLLYWHQL